MRLSDARLYSAAGVRFYRDGELVEDVQRDYLTTVQSAIAPSPLAINLVRSPEALSRDALRERGLTYALADSLDARAPRGIFRGALRWAHQYEGLPVFVSSGPKILSWPGCDSVETYGSEGFAPGRAAVASPLLVESDKGLREIRIYDGQRLFRRFLPNGAHRFEQVLMLDGAVQKDLVVVAEDRVGGSAVSFPHFLRTGGAHAIQFCSDHVNDCRTDWLMAHGPYSLPLNQVPGLASSFAGTTWDGGPSASLPIILYRDTLPRLDSDRGIADAHRATHTPLLEFSDEGAVGVSSERGELYSPSLKQVVNPWTTFGPRGGGPLPLFQHIERYREYLPPSLGAPESGWAAPGERSGIVASLFTSSLRFKRSLTIRTLLLATLGHRPNVVLVVGHGGSVDTVDLASSALPTFELTAGDWFGLYGKHTENAQLFISRSPVRLVRAPIRLELHAVQEREAVQAAARVELEIAGFGFPLDVPVADAHQFLPYVEYLREPTGLQITRGQRIESPGLLELAADGGIVNLSLGRAKTAPGLTLPLRIAGLNPRWSAGLLQKTGYTLQFYGPSQDRWRGIGVEWPGTSYVPLHVDRADATSLIAGHPVIAETSGRELFIQVTNIGGSPWRWHVSVNNPTDHTIRTVLHNAMGLPGILFDQRPIQIDAGGYIVLQ
jgi:hypothetical protein